MYFHRSFLLGTRTFAVVPLLVLALSSRWGRGRRGELFVARSADDPSLRTQVAALSRTVSPDEAQRVAYTACITGRDLHREWRVAWLPGIQNFLVNIGKREGGLCFQWATELLLRLDALKLQTLELHSAESGANTAAEHNVIVVTAKGQAFGEGILLDLWRYSGTLVWTHFGMDPGYRWTENRSEVDRRLGRTRDVASRQLHSTAKSN
jgi:hypothetical protein